MGRRIWVNYKGGDFFNAEGGVWHDPSYVQGPWQVMSFKQFLPRGPIFADDRVVGEREQSLIQIYTDPGGMRTIAVANISFKDPRKAR